MARYSIEESTLTGIADAIRAKTGSEDDIIVAAMADKINGIGAAEEAEYSKNEDAIINRTLMGSYSNDRVTTIGTGAFQRCTSLTGANFPKVEYIHTNAFYGCTKLKSISIP